MGKVREQDPEGFSAFWEIWRPHMRHTDGRADARDGYRKHILAGAEPQDIIDGARGYLRQLASMKPEERKFIPLAKSWINKESYLDWCDRERAYQKRLDEANAVVPERAPASNVHILHKQDNRPTEEERARHAQAVLARAGLAAGNGA